MTSVLLFLSTVSLGILTVKLYKEKQYLRSSMHRYESIYSREDVLYELDRKIQSTKDSLQQLFSKKEDLAAQIQWMQDQLKQNENEFHFQTLEFYDPEYDFLTLEDYKKKFDQIRLEQKYLVKQKKDVISNYTWTVSDDPRKGQRMIDDYLKMIRNAFDVICNSAINDVKIKNIQKLNKRIEDSYMQINKLSKILSCEITEEYKNLRVRELYLKYNMEQKKQEESDKRKIRNEQLRREQRERKEAEKALRDKQRAEEAEVQHRREKEAIDREIRLLLEQDRAKNEKKLATLLKKNEELEKQILIDQENINKAKIKHSQIKSGTIYVISSEKSLGVDIYRIFMTKSSEPRKYIKTMNPYIPFNYTWHLEVDCNDVSTVLDKIHNQIWDKRVNRYNTRRDFFGLTLAEVKKVIYDIYHNTKDIENIIENENDETDF